MSKILLTNDDGILAPGLQALAIKMPEAGEVTIVAPDRERSASGHSLTIDRPLKVTRHADNRFSLNGTPTDCVAIAISSLLNQKPDLLVSGINSGPNLGDDMTYSGTVSAAMEGTIYNVPSIAISLNSSNGEKTYFETAARVALEVARMTIRNHLPYDTLLNVNVPNMPWEELKGTRITRQGKRVYEGAIHDSYSPWGEKYYWIGGGTPYWEHAEDTDMSAVMDGYVSITPLHLDLTNYSAIKLIKKQWTKESSKD